MQGKYPVITLCGSTRFKDQFMEAQKKLTLEGNIVISVGLFGHSGDSEVWENMDEGTLTATKAMLDDMYATISGQKKQSAKLTLEAYVQRYYFDLVVACANDHLSQLTNGLFRLRIKQISSNLVSQSGLDLEVLDGNTGQWRDVSTLSGGESFQASLALALGLSDTVQSLSGGIRLDALFIDEGFGTLDENALQSALELLSELAMGRRLIGIISHMPELREKIPKQLRVTKTIRGARTDYIELD